MENETMLPRGQMPGDTLAEATSVASPLDTGVVAKTTKLPAATFPTSPSSSYPSGHMGTSMSPTESSLERERTGVFTSLVRDDGDIAGLVAYSIYKQNKLDWLQAFELAKRRVPDEAELAAYIIGESTPRRLATYRHLAEATLSGNGPDIEGKTPSKSSYAQAKTGGGGTSSFSPAAIAIFCLVVVVAVIGFWLAAHYTVNTK